MKIPFTRYELAQVRKAISGGIAADVPLLLVDFHAHDFSGSHLLDLLGAFIGGVLLVFKVPNKDLPGDVKLADAFLGDVLPQAVPVVDEVAKAVLSGGIAPSAVAPIVAPVAP